MRRLALVMTVTLAAGLSLGSRAAAQAPDPARARAAHARAAELTRQGRHEEAAAAYEEALRYQGRRELHWVIVGRSEDGSPRDLLDTLGRVLGDGSATEAAPPAVAAADPPVASASDPVAAPPPVEEIGPAPTHSVGAVEPDPAGPVVVIPADYSGSTGASPVPSAEEGGEVVPPQSEVGVLAWSLAGLGGAALLGGLVTGVLALETADELSEVCVDGVCPPSEAGRFERAQTLATITNGLLIGGGLALTAGIITGLLWPSGVEEGEPQVSMACAADGCLGAVRGTF